MPELIQSKSILSPLKVRPDPYFGISYSMNVYRGCQHQCIYCDTRSNVYNIGDLSHIRIKQNAVELLEKQLKKLKNKATIGTGSMNDPYMPVERECGLVRECLKVISKQKYPVHVTTKSNLVLRDLDILSGISKVYAAVSLTITTADDELSKKIEPGAPVTSSRLQAMQALSHAGIYTGAILTPVLPFLTDSTENITKVVNMVARAGGKYILAWMGLSQRPGQREYFYNQLDRLFPGLSTKYNKMFGDNYNCPAPFAENLYKHFNAECQNNKLATRMDFYTPERPSQLKLF